MKRCHLLQDTQLRARDLFPSGRNFHTERNELWRFSEVKPQIVKKDFRSSALNTTIYNLNVTPSALYAMDDAVSAALL